MQWVLLLLFPFWLWLWGCDSEAGEPCQIKSDCKSGLLCCKGTGASVSSRGLCQVSCDSTDVDASVNDGAATDGQLEDTGPPDAAGDDAGGGDA